MASTIELREIVSDRVATWAGAKEQNGVSDATSTSHRVVIRTRIPPDPKMPSARPRPKEKCAAVEDYSLPALGRCAICTAIAGSFRVR